MVKIIYYQKMDIIEEYRERWKQWEYENTHEVKKKDETNRK